MAHTLNIERMWVNQPSTSQPHHELHGVNVLAVRECDRYSRVYFLSGPVVSQQVLTPALSPGWLLQNDEREENALNAAAPDMAKVLRYFLDDVEDGRIDPDTVMLARSALAKGGV